MGNKPQITQKANVLKKPQITQIAQILILFMTCKICEICVICGSFILCGFSIICVICGLFDLHLREPALVEGDADIQTEGVLSDEIIC